MRVKSLGMALGLANGGPGVGNARPPGSEKFANAPPPGLTRPGGGGAGRSWN